MKTDLLLIAALAFALPGIVVATEIPQYKLVIRNHAYQPATLQVPAGIKFKLLVRNEDTTPSEFESNDFNREQIVLPGTTTTVYVGPLDQGRYTYFDDFHRATGNGVLVAK